MNGIARRAASSDNVAMISLFEKVCWNPSGIGLKPKVL